MIISDLTNSNALANPAAFSKPNVLMISPRTSWELIQNIQPAGGVPTNDPNDPSYNWTYFDQAVAQGYQYGRKVWLRMVPQGASGTDWITSLSQQYIATTGRAYNIWWDANFQAYLIAAIQAAGKRYSSNPVVAVFTVNIATDNVGDWTVPHVSSSSSPTGAGNWVVQNSFTCPPWLGTVVVTPTPNQQIYKNSVVFISGFGWFQITAFTGPNSNPSSVTLLNLGVPGNATGGTVLANSIMFFSDVGTLTGPVYRYTTQKFVNAMKNILSAAQAAFPNQIVAQEVGRNGSLDPFPDPSTIPPSFGSPVQQGIGVASGSNPYTFSYSSNVTAANTLLAAISWNSNTGSVSSFSDSLNGSQWSPVSLIQSENRSLALYSFSNTLGGACTISATLSSTFGVVQMALYELPGSNVSFDLVQSNNGSTTTTPASATIVPSYSTDLVIAFLLGGNPITGEAGWTFQTHNSIASQYISPGSVNPINSTFSQPGAAFVATILALSAGTGSYGTTYQYNCATQVAQWGYANLPKGKFAIEKCTFNAGTESVAGALGLKDGSSFYLPAQTVGGSINTSGAIGSIPAGSLFLAQFAWHAFDPTGQYSPTSTASALGPYTANNGVPYNNPLPVYNTTVAIISTYLAAIVETYELDILNLIPGSNWGIGFLGRHIALISPTSDIFNPGFNI